MLVNNNVTHAGLKQNLDLALLMFSEKRNEFTMFTGHL